MDTKRKEEPSAGIWATAAFILIVGGYWMYSITIGPAIAHDQEQSINTQVAQDAMDQYQIAVKGGNKAQICVQAQMVSAALLQAKEEDLYLKWVDTEKQQCARAGIPI